MSSKLHVEHVYNRARFGDLEAGDYIWHKEWPHRVSVVQTKLIDGKRRIAVYPVYTDGTPMPVSVLVQDPESLIPRRTFFEELAQEAIEESFWGHAHQESAPSKGLFQSIPATFRKFKR